MKNKNSDWTIEDDIQEKIKIIGKDIEDYGDMALDAIGEYILNEDGMPDGVAILLKTVLISSQNFDKRYTPLTTFINEAIAWKAKKIVLSSAT